MLAAMLCAPVQLETYNSQAAFRRTWMTCWRWRCCR